MIVPPFETDLSSALSAAGFIATGIVAAGAVIAWRMLAPSKGSPSPTIDWAFTRAVAQASTDAVAITDRAGRLVALWKIDLPLLRPALVGAAILVFVDCLKELPATLLLRPLNVETLSTSIYQYASRGSFEDGALAALIIVAASFFLEGVSRPRRVMRGGCCGAARGRATRRSTSGSSAGSDPR